MPGDKPKKLTPQQWEQEQLKKGYKYAFNYNPEQLEMKRKAGKAPEFYNPEEFLLKGETLEPINGGDPTKAYIKYGELMEQDPTQATQPKTRVAPQRKYFQPIEGRKPMEFGPYQNFDPNTGKYYNPETGEEITPIIEQKAKGGLVKKYGMGGAVTMAGQTGADAAEELAKQSGSGMMGAGTQGLVGGLAGPASVLGTTAATAIQAGNTPNEKGEINENKAALAGGVKWASAAAPIAANPALLAATGGLSALAIPVAGGIGAIVAARKAGSQNDKAVAEFEKQKIEDSKNEQSIKMSEAMRQRELGYSKGGKIVGKGTGTSDGIAAKVRAGSFIVPAKNAEIAEELKEKVLRKVPSKKANLKQEEGEEVKLSNGEYMFTPEEVNELAAQGIDLNKLAPEARHELDEYMKCGGMVKGYGGGGEVSSVGGVPYDKVKGALANKADSTAFSDGYTFEDKNPNATLAPSGIGTNNKYNLGVIQSQEDRFERIMSENDKFLAEVDNAKQQELYKKQSKPILTNQQVIDLASPIMSSKSNWEGGEEDMAKRKAAYDALNKYDKERVDKMVQYLSQNMATGGRVAPPRGYAKGGSVTGDDDEKFINDKRKELDALKKQLDDAAAKEAKTVQEKRAAENKKIAYDAAKKRFDEAVDKFQKAKDGYLRYEKAVGESTKKYPKEASGNTERLKIEIERLDKLRKDVKDKAAIIERANPKQPATTTAGKESTTKVKPYTAGGEQVDLTRPKETKTATEIPTTTPPKVAGTRSAPKRTTSTEMSAAKKAEMQNARTQFEQSAMNTIDQDYADVMAETAALEKGLPKEYEPTVNPPSPSNPMGNKVAQSPQAAGQTTSPNWQGGLTQALGYGIPALQTAVGASALSKLGKRPIDKLDPEYLASIQQAKDRALQAEKEAQFGMTAEEKFLLGQENQGLLNQSRAAARNYSGGSGATAFQQERMGIQDAYGRGLLTKVRDNALKLQKQGVAADRAAYADQLIAGKTDMNRRLFNDQLQAWQQNQLAAGDLTSQGLSNLMSQNRYNQFLQNRESYQ